MSKTLKRKTGNSTQSNSANNTLGNTLGHLAKQTLAGIGLFVSLSGCSAAKLWSLVSHSTASEVKTDIVFDRDHQLAADIYYSNGPADGTVIFIYGGDWRTGSKDIYGFLADGLVKFGYNVVIPNYRLYPDAAYPEFIRDIESFMVWLHANAKQLQLDTQNLFLMGHSAGAYNAAMYLTDVQYRKPLQYSGFIGLAGPYDFFLPTSNPEYLPIFTEAGNFNTTDSLPVKQAGNELSSLVERALLLHGEQDTIVTPKNIAQYTTYLNSHGVKVTSKTYPDVDHKQLVAAINNVPLAPRTIRNDIIDFLEGE